MDFADLFEDFLIASRAEGKADSTLQNYHWDTKRFLDWLDAEGLSHDTETFDARLFRKFILHLQAQDYAPQTVRNTIAALKAIFRFGVFEDSITHDPMAKVDVPKVPEQEVDHFTDEEVYRLLQTCDNPRSLHDLRDRAIMLLLYDTGIRASELVRMQHSDIDTSRGRVVINGKGSRIRVIPFSPNTARAIQQYVRMYERLHGEQPPSSPVFRSERGGNALTRNGLAQVIGKRGKRAHLEAYPHKFRHSFAMAALRNGAREYDIQDILGHTTQAMTRRYAKNTPDTLSDSHQRFSPVGRMDRKEQS